MSNQNTALRFSGGGTNDAVVDLTKDFQNKDNADFLAEASRRLSTDTKPFGKATIALIGEYNPIAYAIRQAESVLRFDRAPSYWSHCFLFYEDIPQDPRVLRSATAPIIWESTIDITGPLSHSKLVNGVGPRSVRDYDFAGFDPLAHHCVPNIALLSWSLTEEQQELVLRRASEPNSDMLRYDFSGLLGTWLSYSLHRADQPNPLAAGKAVYCSAYVQMAYEAVGLDLSMGAHATNTSPEHLWQSAKYFQDYYAKAGHEVKGFYCVRDPYCEMFPNVYKEINPFSGLKTLTSFFRRSHR